MEKYSPAKLVVVLFHIYKTKNTIIFFKYGTWDFAYDLSYIHWLAKIKGDGGVGLTFGRTHSVSVPIITFVRTKLVLLFTGHDDRNRLKGLSV